MTKNTTSRQDAEIREAENSSAISNLIDIIRDLDEQITEWHDAAKKLECDTPEELREYAKKQEGGA